MKKILIISILVLEYFAAISQQTKPIVKFRHCNTCTSSENQDDPIANPSNPSGLFDYLQITDYQTNDVESDFDMRNPGATGTKFHEGIDYANYATYTADVKNPCAVGVKDKPMGDAILSVEGGIITSINGGVNLKSMRVLTTDGLREYGYLHIFHTTNKSKDIDGKYYQKCGNFVLKQVDKGQNWAIINLGATPVKAYSSNYPYVKVTFNGVTYNTQNWVGQYEEIAPVGDSYGLTGNIDAHLHLNLYYIDKQNKNAKIQSDPWCEVEHTIQQNQFINLLLNWQIILLM